MLFPALFRRGLSGHPVHHLLPAAQRGGSSDRRRADRAAGVGEAQSFFACTSAQNFRDESRCKVIASAGRIHRPDPVTGQPEGFPGIFHEASVFSQLDDHIPDTEAQELVQ